MADVICNKNCKYRKAVYCGLDFTMLNDFGQCVVWFNRDGNLRVKPDYRRDLNKDKNQENKSFNAEKDVIKQKHEDTKKEKKNATKEEENADAG